MTEQISAKVEAGGVNRLDLYVRVPAAIVTQTYTKVLHDLRSEVQVDGYRVGKAPLSAVRRRAGNYLNQRVSSQLVKDNADKAAKLQGLPPVGLMPEVYTSKAAEENQPFEFRVHLSHIRARVTKLYPYHEFTMAAPSPRGNFDGKIEAKMHALLCEHAESRVRGDSEQVELGDRIIFSCTVIDDQQPQPIELKNGEQQTIVLRAEDKLPGDITHAMHGLRCGETRRMARIIRHTEGWSDDHLEGQKVIFDLKVHKIEQLLLPELNDVLVQKLTGNLSSVEALYNKLQQECLDAEAEERQLWLRQRVEEILLSNSEVEIPQQLLDSVTKLLLKSGKFGKTVGDEQDSLWQHCYEQAKYIISITSIVEEIARRENIASQKSFPSHTTNFNNAVLDHVISVVVKDDSTDEDEEEEVVNSEDNELLAQLRHDLIENSAVMTIPPYEQFTPDIEQITVSDQRIEKELSELRYLKSAYRQSDAPISDKMDLGILMSRVVSVNGEVKASESTMHAWLSLPKGETLSADSAGLMGMRKGERKTMLISEANPDQQTDKIEVTFIVHEVQELTPPDVDDQFAQQFFGMENVAALRAKIKREIEAREKHDYILGVLEKAFFQLISGSEVRLDQEILDKIVTTVLASKELRQSVDISDDLSEEDAAQKVRKQHTSATQQYLTLHEIARREKLIDADATAIDKLEVVEKVVKFLRKKWNLSADTNDEPHEGANVIRVDDD